jgi:hypothetical protein
MDLKKLIKARFSELVLVARLLLDRHRKVPTVMLFPSNQAWDAASNLRAWLVAPALERLGWRAVVVPEPLSLAQRRRVILLARPDVLYLQQTRHPLNQPKLYQPLPCVLDADDADYLDPRHQARIAESALDAKAVIGGSTFVARCLAQHNHEAHVIWTSSPGDTPTPLTAPEHRGPIVIWAHATPLEYPREADFIRETMRLVCEQRRCEFWLFGCDETRAREWFMPIREAGGICRAIPTLDYTAYLNKISEAAIGLQPIAPDNRFSQGKSFGKLLAYLAGQVAVVASHAVDHPYFFRHGVNGLLPEHEPSAWAQSIVSLLDNPDWRCRLARAGHRDFEARLTTDVFARLLDPVLKRAAGMGLDESGELANRKTLLAALQSGRLP